MANVALFFRRSSLPIVLVAFLMMAARSNAVAQEVPLPSPTRLWVSPGHTRYYVDSVGGSDANDGKSPGEAWQTLTNVNSGTFAPGDWIFLKCGSHWNSYFSPGGSGGDRHPVKVTSYGDGPAPQLDAQAATLATVYIHNGSYWDIENLDITNTSTSTIPLLRGVEVSLTDYGTSNDITLKNLYVHDITSAEDKFHGGSGIFCDNRGDKVQSRFVGLLIENNHLKHTDRNGITMDCGYWDRSKWYPNLNVVIRGNFLEDIGGDCICAIGCDGALIEKNVVRGGRERAPDWATGIWVWSCDNSIIQYNESSGLHGTMDAQGFDADYNSHNTIIQYNYSHDNEGGFVMVVDNGDAKPPTYTGNSGTIVRYNISQNDGFRTFTFSGPTKHTLVYNNDIYIGKTDNPSVTFSWNWGGTWPDDTEISNNIYYVDGVPHFDQNNMTSLTYTNNLVFGNMTIPSTTTATIKADPLFKAVGTAADGMNTSGGYHLAKNSPAKNAGIVIPNNGGRDFWGKRVPSDKPPAIGAGE